jgi:hypothetical protein
MGCVMGMWECVIKKVVKVKLCLYGKQNRGGIRSDNPPIRSDNPPYSVRQPLRIGGVFRRNTPLFLKKGGLSISYLT